MRLPEVLEHGDDSRAASYLRIYYSSRFDLGGPVIKYSGAFFDDLETKSPDEFTAEDIVAVGYLSIKMPGTAMVEILEHQRGKLNKMLQAIGPDRWLGDEDVEIAAQWPAWALETQLRTIRGIDYVTASKLIARKRPNLYPVIDSVSMGIIGDAGRMLVPLHEGLRENPELRDRLVDLRQEAGLPQEISELRVLDVITWMDGLGFESYAGMTVEEFEAKHAAGETPAKVSRAHQ